MRPIELAYMIVRYSGLPFLFREVFFRNRTRIIVMHDPGVEALERTLDYLVARYNIVSLDEFLSGLSLPPKALVVTLDDGHKGNADLIPVFRRFGVRPTIFLCAGIIDTNRHFWFLHKPLRTPVSRMKKWPNSTRLDELATMGFDPVREFDERHALDRKELIAMKDTIDLQSHGLLHPCLPNCTDLEVQNEVFGSKELLETRFGIRVSSFAFPNGDYCQRDLDLVKQAGYQAALTVDMGFNEPGDDPYRLKRLSMDDLGNVDAVSVKASGVWSLFRILLGRQRRSRMVARGSFGDFVV